VIKRRIAVVVGIAVLALSIGGVFGRLFAQRGATLMQSLQLFGRVVDIVISNYVEKVDADKLIKDGIRGMLQSLDPYTEYLEAQDRPGGRPAHCHFPD
jgi:carboxyl-terminal processing protease